MNGQLDNHGDASSSFSASPRSKRRLLAQEILGRTRLGAVIAHATFFAFLSSGTRIMSAGVDDLTYTFNGGAVYITDCNSGAAGELIIPPQIEGFPVISIQGHAFADCDYLTRVVIPNSVFRINSAAFKDCFRLESVEIPSSVTRMEGYVFSGCNKLLSVVIPDSVTDIGTGDMFNDCWSLTSVILPSSLTRIGGNSFHSCYNLTSITIPNSVTFIDRWAFYDCRSLTGVTIPEGVATIDEDAFYGCDALTSLSIPASVTVMKHWAMSYCDNLTAIIFDGNAPSIEPNTFQGLPATVKIYVSAGATGFNSTIDGIPVIIVPNDDLDSDGLLDAYETNTGIYISPADTGSNPNDADSDDDGLADGAEVNIHGSNPNLSDSDGDGFDDGFEVSTGFSPTSGSSTPDAISSIRTAVEFRFNAANGDSYMIESSANSEEWEVVEMDIIGEGETVTRFYSVEGTPKRFFRATKQ